jgi:hypothetical protein
MKNKFQANKIKAENEKGKITRVKKDQEPQDTNT